MAFSGQEDDYQQIYKIVIIGDAGVGKTHLLKRYTQGEHRKDIIPTIGVEFATKMVTLKNGGRVKAQIWDTAGQERYRAIAKAHYRKAVGALLVYDVTKPTTFANLEKWLTELKEVAEPDIVIMTVGNKIDLLDENRGQQGIVSKQEGAAFAEKHGTLFEQSSGIANMRVTECFETVLESKFNFLPFDIH
eukprot:TRINITY_DN2182_c0_g1_i9.p1 TRINITY_DN2182_c0_g1~~TRINITY_DN2182_c0_g1_i9.p1  ORF type:complete len:190 (-),score=34.23 TRINITY_DN2182_c0_g1_i9:295-864(-)